MRWIGKHIFNLISIFKNDVYLDDISTGTIASGGNLGLDSNNKIVKAAEASGDIESISIVTDSGGGSAASATSGNAEFSILGANGVGVTNSGTTITAAAVPGEIDHDSLLNFDANEHFTQANITTVGTVGTGVWQGTAIASAYIADDAVTFAKAQGVATNIYDNAIKLIPSDFMANDDGGNQKFGVGYVDHAGSSDYGMRTANNATELFAFVSIPQGMKATHVDIYDKNDLAVEVFEVQINTHTMTSKGSGNANTTIDLGVNAVSSTATNLLAIEVTTTSATNDKVWGGKVTIAAI